MEIKKVIFNDPATIVYWSDGSKTVVKCKDNEEYDPEKGLAMAVAKKALGNHGNYYEIFKKWLPKEEETSVVKDLITALNDFSKAIGNVPNEEKDVDEDKEYQKAYKFFTDICYGYSLGDCGTCPMHICYTRHCKLSCSDLINFGSIRTKEYSLDYIKSIIEECKKIQEEMNK